jgi:hypothetical protein
MVMAADFMERVATDAVDNGEEFVTRGGGAAVLMMGNLLLSWYRSRREPLPSSKDGGFSPSLPGGEAVWMEI